MRKALFRMGIVRSGHHLSYGWDHGFGITFGHQWLPHPIQRIIVVIFNNTTCFLLGHSIDLPGKCSACCRITDPEKYREFEAAMLDDSE